MKGFRSAAVSAPESTVRVGRYSVQRKNYIPKHNTVELDAPLAHTRVQAVAGFK